MFKKFWNNFKKLPESNKSLVYLMLIYFFWVIIANLFVVIYIFKLNDSINQLIIYSILNYTFIFVWFSVVWYLMALFNKSIKYLFIFSYLFFIFSFLILLFFWWNIIWIYLYGSLYWLALWLYWNWVHTQELFNIKNKNRDFYSSSISLWKNILEISTPFLVSAIFYIWTYFNIDWYIILFCILPLGYMISFRFINQIDDYKPKKLNKNDIKNFFNLKKYKFWHLYFLFWWLQLAITTIILPIIILYILKTEINIWLFQWFLAIISTFLIVHFSLKRKENNRFKYYTFFWILYFLNFMFFVFNFNIFWFIIFSLLNLILIPLFRVSTHVYDLSLMDNIRTWVSDFYPAMILREVILYFWRLIWLGTLLIIVNKYNFSEITIYKWWLTFIAIMFLFLILSIYFREKNEK